MDSSVDTAVITWIVYTHVYTICTRVSMTLSMSTFTENTYQLTQTIGPMSAHRLRRRPNIDPTFVQWLIFAVIGGRSQPLLRNETLTQCWFIVGPASWTLAQH